MVSLSNLSCISFNIIFVGVESCIFYFEAFIRIMKGWSRDLAKYDDDENKVEEENFKIFNDFDVSSSLLLRVEENKNWEIFVVCWFKCWREWFAWFNCCWTCLISF